MLLTSFWSVQAPGSLLDVVSFLFLFATRSFLLPPPPPLLFPIRFQRTDAADAFNQTALAMAGVTVGNWTVPSFACVQWGWRSCMPSMLPHSYYVRWFSDRVVVFDSVQDMENHITAKGYGTGSSKRYVCVCVCMSCVAPLLRAWEQGITWNGVIPALAMQHLCWYHF